MTCQEESQEKGGESGEPVGGAGGEGQKENIISIISRAMIIASHNVH